MHDKQVSSFVTAIFDIYIYMYIFIYIRLFFSFFFNWTNVFGNKNDSYNNKLSIAVLKSHCMSITLACWQNQVQVNLEDFFLSFFSRYKLLLQHKVSLKLLYIGCIISCAIAFVPKTKPKIFSD